MNISAPFIARPVATSLLAIAVLLAGLLGYRTLPVSALPPVDFPTIQVVTQLPGANPDTVASLKLQGITGVIYIELSGSSPEAAHLASNEDTGNPPEIPSVPSTLTTLMDMLPQILEKVSHISDQADKLFSNKNIAAISSMIGNMQKASKNANELTKELKENPTKLIFSPKKPKETSD